MTTVNELIENRLIFSNYLFMNLMHLNTRDIILITRGADSQMMVTYDK